MQVAPVVSLPTLIYNTTILYRPSLSWHCIYFYKISDCVKIWKGEVGYHGITFDKKVYDFIIVALESVITLIKLNWLRSLFVIIKRQYI